MSALPAARRKEIEEFRDQCAGSSSPSAHEIARMFSDLLAALPKWRKIEDCPPEWKDGRPLWFVTKLRMYGATRYWTAEQIAEFENDDDPGQYQAGWYLLDDDEFEVAPIYLAPMLPEPPA